MWIVQCLINSEYLHEKAIFLKADQLHNQNPILGANSELPYQMKAFIISRFKKKDPISEVKGALGNSFGCKLDYVSAPQPRGKSLIKEIKPSWFEARH